MSLKRTLNIATIILLAVTFIQCVESVGSNPGAVPAITVKSPVSGDTVQVGKNEIKYEASDYPGGAGLGAYEVYINDSFVEKFDQNDDGTNPKLYLTIDSTMLNKKISYFVIAYNNSGGAKNSGTFSNIFVRQNTDPPAKPTNLVLQKLSDSELILFWDDSSDNENGFQIWRKEGGGQYRLIKELAENATSHRDFGLSPFVTYFYKVRAFNEYGFSPFSNEMSSTGGATGEAPSNLEAEALGASAVRLTWIDNSSVENGFKIERKQISEDTWETAGFVGPNVQEFIDATNLLPGATYKYRVTALLSNSQAVSSEVSVTTAFNDVPAPGNLVATFNSKTNSVVVTWTDRTLQENGTIIQRKKGTTGTYVEVGIAETDITTFTDSNLEPEVIYSYRAQHTTTGGTKTNFSNVDTAYVPKLPPLPPTNLKIIPIITNRSYGLIWDYDKTQDIDGFELHIKDNTAGTDFTVFKLYSKDRIADSVVVPTQGNEYFFKIRAFRGSNFSLFSNIVSTSGGTGLFSVIALETTSNHVVLRWNDPFSNEVGYRVQRLSVTANETEFSDIALVAPGSGGNLIYQDNNVTRGINYKYRVSAVLPTEIISTEEISVTIPNF